MESESTRLAHAIKDIALLLAMLDYLMEAAGEDLDPEDMAILAQIRAAYEPKE